MKKIIKQFSEDLKLSPSETELTISRLLDRPRFEIYLRDDLDETEATVLRIKIHLLKKGVPIEYITHRAQFLNRTLEIQPGVFIPRLETEYFVDLIKSRLNFDPRRILDIGTGCGALSIGLADLYPAARIFSVDRSRDAVVNARLNIACAGLLSQIHLLCADFLGSVRSVFDLIVSNPPYVPTARIRYLPSSVRDFEPRSAIDGGVDGTSFIRKLLEHGPSHLTRTGAMAIEIDEEQVDILGRCMNDYRLSYSFQKDLFGRFRYLLIGNFNHTINISRRHLPAVKRARSPS